MHKLLERQLRKQFGSLEAVPPSVRALLDAIDRSYQEADQDRALVERSLELASQEMLQLNQDLQRRQQELRVILDSVPAAIFFKDTQNRILNLNEAGARLFGKTRAEVEGQDTANLMPAEVAKALHEDDLRVIRSGEARLGVEESHPGPDGSIHWFRTDKVPHYGPKGKVDGVIVLSSDITSQKDVEAQLQERNVALKTELENRAYTESLRSAILDSALDCIILMDEHGIVQEFNPAAQRTFGFTKEQAVGKRLADLIIPEKFRQLHAKGLQKYLETGEGPVLRKRIEISGVRADGQEVPVELAIIPFKAAGRTMFAGYLRDLTDRVKAQDEIRRRVATIQLLQQVPLVANEAETVDEAARLCLDKVCEYTGWPVGHAYFVNDAGTEMVSHGVWHLPPGDRFAGFRRVTEAMPMGPGIGLPGRVWETRKPLWIPDVMKDSNFPRAKTATEIGVHGAFGFPVHVRGRVLVVLEFFSENAREPDQELLTVMANVGDQLGRVLERRRAEAELKAAYEQLQEVDRARIQFINTAAHELGTPLTPIKLQVEMVKNRLTAGTEPQQRKSVEILERNVTRLSHLVKDLLDSARLQTGQMQVVHQRLDLSHEAERAVEAYRQIAATTGIRVHWSAPSPLWVLADLRRVGQVLDNLLSNAVKFTPANGDIHVSVLRDGESAKVSVHDSGIGVRPEALSRLFHPFSQVHDTMQITQPGTGLGLYISKGIVEALGGDIGCESNGLGQGSTFWFKLPLGQVGEATTEAPPPPPPAR